MIRSIRNATAPEGKKTGRKYGRNESRSTIPVKESTYFLTARSSLNSGYRYFAAHSRRR